MVNNKNFHINKQSLRRDFLVFLLILWPFFINDFYLIALVKPGQSVSYETLKLLWSLDLVFFTLIPTATLYALYKRKYFNLREIGLRGKIQVSGIVIALLLAVISHKIITGYIEPRLLQYGCCRTCGGYPFFSAGFLKWATIVYAALSAGFLEEIIFRGLLIGTLRKYTAKKWVIIIVSSFTFAAIHWCGGSGKMIGTFAFGVIFALLYMRKGRLAEPIIFHILVDFLAFQ